MKANVSYRSIIAAMILSIMALITLLTGAQAVYAEGEELYVMGTKVTESGSFRIYDANWYGLATYDSDSHVLKIQSTAKPTTDIPEPEVEDWRRSGINITQKQIDEGGSEPFSEYIDAAAIYAAGMNLTIELDKTYCELGFSPNTGKNAGIYVDGNLTVTGEGVITASPSGAQRYGIFTTGDLTLDGPVNIRCGNTISKNGYQQTGIETGGNITLLNGSSIYSSLSTQSGTYAPSEIAVKAGGTISASAAPLIPEGAGTSAANGQYAVKGTIYAESGNSYADGDNVPEVIAIDAAELILSDTAEVNVEGGAVQTVENNKYVLVSGEYAVGIRGAVKATDSSNINVTGNSNVGIQGTVSAEDASTITASGSADERSASTGISLPESSSANLNISDKAKVEASGSGAAISGIDDASVENIKLLGAMVGEKAEEAADWDLAADLGSFKYVSVPGNYPLSVGGIPVGRANQEDVLGDGTVSYDPNSKTLTLNGAGIGTSEAHADNGILTSVPGITIDLQGENTIVAGSTGISAENTDVTISGDGSLDINVDGGDTQTYIKGIYAKTLDVDSVDLKISCENGKTDNMDAGYEDIQQTAGLYTTGKNAETGKCVAIKNAGLDISLKIPYGGDASGIFVKNVNEATFDGSVSIGGESEVNITIADQGTASRVVTGIISSNIHDSRKAAIVTISDSSKVNIDTSAAKADAADGDGFNGGIYGTVAVTGTSALTVKAGYGGTVAFGAGWNQKMTFGGGDNTFFTDIKAADDAQISLASGDSAKETYAALCSVVASDNAKVEARAGASDNGSSFGTAPYQGVVASGDSEVTATGADYGTGIIIAEDSSTVTAEGGTKAVNGMVNKSSQYFDGKTVVFPVDLTKYTGYKESDGAVVSPKVDVNTGAASESMASWNGTDALGGEESKLKYVKLPGKAGITLKAGEGHEQLASDIADKINEKKLTEIKASAVGSDVKMYIESTLNVMDAEKALEDILSECGIDVDNGQHYRGNIGLKPLGEYEDFDDYWFSERDSDGAEAVKPISDETVFYMHWCDSVGSLDLTLKAPVCGNEVKKVKIDNLEVPDNRPEFAVSGANAGKVAGESATAVWRGADQDTGYYIGTFKGGTEYKAFLLLRSAFGYYFPDDFKVKVNGTELADGVTVNRDYIMLQAPITADHNWGEPEVIRKATITVAGEQKFTCLSCGETKIEAIPKLPKLKNTLKASGRKVKIKASTIRKRSVKISRKKAIKVSGNKGKVTYKKGTLKYKKLSKSKLKKLAKKFVVNKKNGKITVKKGLKKGTYKLQVKVTAAGNATYKAKTKTVTVTFKVK